MPTAIILGVFAFSLLSFILEKPRYDLVALLSLVILVILGALAPEEAFSSFSNPAIIVFVTLFVFARAFHKTGLIAAWGRYLLSLNSLGEGVGIFCIVFGVGLLSGWVLSVPFVAVLIPVFLSGAREKRISSSLLLMPLSFGALMGSSLSLIGSSANLGIQAALLSPVFRLQYPNLDGFTLFELFPLGIILVVVAGLYFSLAGRFWLPDNPVENTLTEQYRARRFLTELKVEGNSSLIGKTLAESGIGSKDQIAILSIFRGGESLGSPGPESRIEGGDLILVQGESRNLLRFRAERNLTLQEEGSFGQSSLGGPDSQILEAIVAPGARYAGRTLKEIGFRAQLGLNVLALWRHGEIYPVGLKEIPLRVGDVLLLQGRERDVERLRRDKDFLLAESVEMEPSPRSHSWVAGGLFVASLWTSYLGWTSLPLALLLSVCLLVLLRVLNLKDLYEAVDWPGVVLLVGSLALAIAFVKDRLDESVASFLLSMMPSPSPIHLSLGLFFVLAVGLTSLAKNSVAGIWLTPIALAFAQKAGVPAHVLLVPVLVGCSCSFLTPFAHQANSMVMGPGGYKYSDYFKVGFPLVLLVGLLTVLFVPVLWSV